MSNDYTESPVGRLGYDKVITPSPLAGDSPTTRIKIFIIYLFTGGRDLDTVNFYLNEKDATRKVEVKKWNYKMLHEN